MLAEVFRAALIFLVAVLLDTMGQAFGDVLLGDIATQSNLGADAPPLVTWGYIFVDWFLELTIISLVVYLLVAAWIENQSVGGF